jgi:hypothetical protein
MKVSCLVFELTAMPGAARRAQQQEICAHVVEDSVSRRLFDGSLSAPG